MYLVAPCKVERMTKVDFTDFFTTDEGSDLWVAAPMLRDPHGWDMLSIGMPNKTEGMRSDDLITLISAHRMNMVATFIHNDPRFFFMIGEYKERMRAAKPVFNIQDVQGVRGDMAMCARSWAAKQIGMSSAWKGQLAALAGAAPRNP